MDVLQVKTTKILQLFAKNISSKEVTDSKKHFAHSTNKTSENITFNFLTYLILTYSHKLIRYCEGDSRLP